VCYNENESRDSMSKKYQTKTKVTLEEFQKAYKIIPNNYWVSVISITLFGSIFVIAYSIIGKINFTLFLVLEAILFGLVLINQKLTADKNAEKYYNKLYNEKDNEYSLIFSDDDFEQKKKDSNQKIKYSDIKKIIETDTNFYLYLGKSVVIVDKYNCEIELISFIREIDETKYINKRNNKTFKKNNNKLIKKMMNLLLILTILSIFFGMESVDKVNEYLNVPFIANLNQWVGWLWLPIPIASIILGVRFNSKGLDCKANVAVGVIVGIILILIGSSCLTTKKLPYDNINDYKSIMGVLLPEEGIYTLNKSNNYEGHTNISNVKSFIAYYNGNETNFKIFEEEILNNDNWIKGSALEDGFDIYIDKFNKINNNSYYLIYNETTDEYNTLTTENGMYHIYLIKYHPNETKMMEILEFDFENDDK